MVKTARTAIRIAMAGAIILLLAACSGEDDAGKTGQAKQSAQPSAAAAGARASLSVKADKTHAVQPGDEITVTISVTDFQLSPESIGAANRDGVGHYRIYLDGASGDDHLAVGAATVAKVTIPGDISDGSHDLRVVLQNNDQSPLDPPVEGSVLLIVYRL